MRLKTPGIFRDRRCGGLATAFPEVRMNPIVQITPQFAVTGALGPGDLVAAASAGFRSLISNLPDGELHAYPGSAEEARLASAAGLQYCHLPVRKGEIGWPALGRAMRQALADLPAPVLAHCASGQRSALAWAAAAAGYHPTEAVLAVLAEKGFRFEPVRAELEALAGEGQGPLPAGLELPRPSPAR